MSAPVSAMMTSAVRVLTPGMVQIRSRNPRKGFIVASIRVVMSAIAAVCWSIRSRCTRAKNAWWSLNRPLNASVNAGIFERSRRLARSASPAGSRFPAINDSSMARPDTPRMSEATADSLIPASSSSFSSRCTSRERSRVIAVRARVRSRSCRIGSGGTNEPRTRPCAPSWASQVASATSVLRPGQVLHVPRIDQQHLEPGVLQQVVERLPVVAGGLHHRTRDPLGDQMLTQRQDLARHRAPGGNRLNGFTAPSTSDPHAHLGVPLRDIQPSTAGMNHFHGPSLPSHPHACGVRRGEGRESSSLTLGLDGTNPRFPRKPSATMLTYRLTGTTEAIGIDHDEPDQSPPRQQGQQEQPRPIFAHHGAPRRRRRAADLGVRGREGAGGAAVGLRGEYNPLPNHTKPELGLLRPSEHGRASEPDG